MEYSSNLYFAGFECKISKYNNKRRENLAKAEISQHNFIMSRHNCKGINRKNVATKENYVAIENGRAMRRVKTS